MTASRKALIVVGLLVGIALGLPWAGAVPTASAQSISVTAANPPSGEQGALNLPVIINGKGFKNGAKAKFLKTGTTDPAGVNVKSTQFVSSTQLIATIDITDTAALALFDIQVANTDGRTGKGTELFSVTEKAGACVVPELVPATGYASSDLPGFPGYFDSTFGNGTGKSAGVPGPSLSVEAVATQYSGNDARIVVAGYSNDPCTGGQNAWMIARYLPNGQVDDTFGSGGVVKRTFTKGSQIYGLAVDASNRIIVVGSTPGKTASWVPAVARYTANGAPDVSFGGAGTGIVTLADGKYTGVFRAATVDSRGRIVVAGTSGSVMKVARLTSSGALDRSFNLTGQYLFTAFMSDAFAVSTQTIDSKEYIVIAGERAIVNGSWYWDAAIWRFTDAGALDAGFGTGGMVVTDYFGHNESFEGLAIDSENRIVVAAAADTTGAPSYTLQFVLARFTVSGAPDASFGTNGWVWPTPGLGHDLAYAVAIQADGRILAAGYASNLDAWRLAAWRFMPDGTIDSSFGLGGWVFDPIIDGGGPHGQALMLWGNDRLIVAGQISVSGLAYPILVRFWQ
jgi:uncharacterized delta-60 repeat protein